MIEQLECGAWVIANDTHHKAWIQEKGDLQHDRWFNEQVCRHTMPCIGTYVIEAGSHIGTITAALLEHGSTVFAFEPNPEAYECLVRNCENVKSGIVPGNPTPRGEKLWAYNMALGDFVGTAHLSLDQNAGASHMADSGVPVEVTTIDAMGLECTLLKADCEGWEAKVLRGGRKMIAKCRPVMILEVNRQALERAGDSEEILLSLVEELGYRWQIIQPGSSRGHDQYDIRCIPKEQYMEPIALSELKNRKDVGLWLNERGLLGAGAEIGVAYGENAEAILEKWKGERLYLIDPWIQQPKEDYTDGDMGMNFEAARWYCHGKLARFKPRWHEVRAKSDDALKHVGDASLDFVYIDGSHQDPQVTRDVEQWWHKVRPGGLFGGHDYMDIDTGSYRCDVKRVVDSFVQRNGLTLHVTNTDPLDNSWWIIKS